MSDYDDSNTIVLFKNEKYEQGGNHPVYKGSVKMDGKQKNVSVWIRQASGDGKMEKGTTFLSGTLDEWESKEKGKDSGWKGDQAKEDLPF